MWGVSDLLCALTRVQTTGHEEAATTVCPLMQLELLPPCTFCRSGTSSTGHVVGVSARGVSCSSGSWWNDQRAMGCVSLCLSFCLQLLFCSRPLRPATLHRAAAWAGSGLWTVFDTPLLCCPLPRDCSQPAPPSWVHGLVMFVGT